MINNFINVGTQVSVLGILIFVGFICGKWGILKENAIGSFTDLVLNVAAPCIIIVSFQMEFEIEMMKGLAQVAFFACLIFGINILLANLLIHDGSISRESVLRFGSIFSNCGFMGIPLIYAILGNQGIFYISAYIAVFNVISWTYGVNLMNKGREKGKINPLQIVLNPGNIGTAIGLILYFCSISLPPVLYTSMEYLGALNTPLPMIIIGYQLSKVSLLGIFKDKKLYMAVFVRLILVPILAAVLLVCLKVDMMIAVTCIVAAAAPAAALTTMFSNKYDRNVTLSVNIVSVSTLLSVLTMPIIVGMVQYFLS